MEFENISELKKILDEEEYPYENEDMLKTISMNFAYPLDIICAYQLGVIQGQKTKK